MKIALLVLPLLVLSSISHASSGQTFRENVRYLAAAHNLQDQGMVDGAICGKGQDDQFVMLTTKSGELFAVAMDSFYSSAIPDGGDDRVDAIKVSDCSTMTFKF